MASPGALLDIDGTLLDTNWLHTVAWWRAFRRLGHTYPMVEIHRLIGMGGDKLVPELAGREIDGAVDAYSDEFARLRPETVRLPGARELVVALDELGIRCALASSAQEGDLEHFRAVLDIDDHLAGATSSGDATESKPDEEIFEVALERFGLDRNRTVVIGDTIWDAKAAKRAGLSFVGVETGGWSAPELRSADALAVYPSAVELAADLHGPIGDVWA